jgi:gluconolactonase
MVNPASGRACATLSTIVSGTMVLGTLVLGTFVLGTFVLGTIVILSASAGRAQSPTDIIADGAKWEEVSRAGKVFGEGVVVAKDGKVYLSDITITLKPEDNPAGTVYRFDPATGETTKYLEPSGMSNGLHVDKNGDLWLAQGAYPKGARRLSRQNMTTGALSVVAETYQGKKLDGPNDITSDAQGRIYFTDALYLSADAMELPNAVYRVDPDGTLTQISTDILRPNGIEVSPDGHRLYVAACNGTNLKTNPNGPAQDHFGISDGGVVAYDLDAKGEISNGRVIYVGDMCVDGMAMDTDGNLYLAQHNGNLKDPKHAIAAIDPTGKVLVRFPVPEEGAFTTNLAFGRGGDASSLYLSTAFPWRLYRIKTSRRGHYFE